VTSSRLTVGRTAAGARLDRWLAESLPDLSRSRIQHLIAGQHVTVNGAATKASHRLHGGETIEIDVPPLPPARWKVRQGPICAQRRPGPQAIEASISSTVASPAATMCRSLSPSSTRTTTSS